MATVTPFSAGLEIQSPAAPPMECGWVFLYICVLEILAECTNCEKVIYLTCINGVLSQPGAIVKALFTSVPNQEKKWVLEQVLSCVA